MSKYFVKLPYKRCLKGFCSTYRITSTKNFGVFGILQESVRVGRPETTIHGNGICSVSPWLHGINDTALLLINPIDIIEVNLVFSQTSLDDVIARRVGRHGNINVGEITVEDAVLDARQNVDGKLNILAKMVEDLAEEAEEKSDKEKKDDDKKSSDEEKSQLSLNIQNINFNCTFAHWSSLSRYGKQ